MCFAPASLAFVKFQFSIGDAALTAVPGFAGMTSFNSLLEMPECGRRSGTSCLSRFQFSIGDATWRRNKSVWPRRGLFQFSIGDAPTPKYLSTEAETWFQFSIGDAPARESATCADTRRGFNSLLEMLVKALYLLVPLFREGFNSLLEMQGFVDF